MRNKERAKQRLARAIEDSFPATLTDFIDTLLPAHDGYCSARRYSAQKRALEYAKKHYNPERSQ